MTKNTKKLRTFALIFSILSVAAMFLPMLWFVIAAFIGNAATIYKVALVSSVAVAIVMTAISVLTKWAARSRIWIVLLGLFFCLDYLLTMIVVFAITQIVDELVLCPIKSKLWQKYTINREMDKRGA